jgi:glucose-6-phosphate isomerase
MDKNDVERAFTLFFSLEDGRSDETESQKRYLSEVKNIFLDSGEAERRLQKDNPLVYEFYELGIPENMGDLAFGTSIVYPG